MPISEEVKEQHKKLKDMSLKEKISYIWGYYKFHIIASILGIFIISSLIVTFINGNKEVSIYASMINCNYAPAEENTFMNGFAEYAGIDNEKTQTILDTSMTINLDSSDPLAYAYIQKLMALISTKELDVMITDEQVMNHFSPVGAYLNIEEALPVDLKVLVEASYEYFYFEDEEAGRIPVGIILKDCKKLLNEGVSGTGIDNQAPIFSLIANGAHSENSILFLRYLIK